MTPILLWHPEECPSDREFIFIAFALLSFAVNIACSLSTLDVQLSRSDEGQVCIAKTTAHPLKTGDTTGNSRSGNPKSMGLNPCLRSVLTWVIVVLYRTDPSNVNSLFREGL